MTKKMINTAPEALKRNFYNRLYGSRSMAESYLTALDYAKTIHYDVPEYVPVYGVIAERIKATGDMRNFRTFVNAHGDELRSEQRCDEMWRSLREFMKGPDAETVAKRNAAAYAADQLEQAVNARGHELLSQRELSARSAAFNDARAELSGGKR